jgi:hypothetical protein
MFSRLGHDSVPLKKSLETRRPILWQANFKDFSLRKIYSGSQEQCLQPYESLSILLGYCCMVFIRQ